MKTLTVTLPDQLAAQVERGEKKSIRTKKNRRKDRYFAAQRPEIVKINGKLYKILRSIETETEWEIRI